MDILKKNSVPQNGMKPGAEPEGDLEFTVMPDVGKMEKTTAVAVLPPRRFPRVLLTIGVSIVLLTLIAYAAYFGYQKYFADDGGEGPLPSIYVDDSGAAKDTDGDGLADQREAELATKPGDKDTDGDGLSDGDEVSVYQSDPLLPDTDGDKFDDGTEVARGFSPSVASSDPATAQDLQRWRQGIEQFGLHEPTQSTLKLKAVTVQPDQSRVKYVNLVFKYSIDLPSILAYRESSDRSMVGIFISGTQDLDPDFDTDPIFVSSAALAGGQSLRDFVAAQYPNGDVSEIKVGAENAVFWAGVSADDCAQDRTFFAKGSAVVSIALSCSDATPFRPYYDGLVQSFRFQ